MGNTQVSTSVILQLVAHPRGGQIRSGDGGRRLPAHLRPDEKIRGRGSARPADGHRRHRHLRGQGAETDHAKSATRAIFRIKTKELEDATDIKKDEAIDQFRINLAQQSIEKLYRDKNYPFAHVRWSPEELQNSGSLVFHITEGPQVRVRKIDFIGNNSFGTWKLKDQIKTGTYIFIFNPGKYDPEELDEDVTSLSQILQGPRFFRRSSGEEDHAIRGHEGNADHLRDR